MFVKLSERLPAVNTGQITHLLSRRGVAGSPVPEEREDHTAVQFVGGGAVALTRDETRRLLRALRSVVLPDEGH